VSRFLKIRDKLHSLFPQPTEKVETFAGLLTRKKVSMDVPQFIAGRFRIEREIGTGGMGTVYLATHLGLERPVAVKIIKREFAGDADVADRFLREARTMAKLHHPHAAMIFDAGNLPDGRHFIVMEFVEGETLSQVLAREGRFSAQRAVDIATQICDVLEEAHRLGIIHRDLKPSNILIGKRGVCVLDFGVAKVLASVGGVDCDAREHGVGAVGRHAALHVARTVFGAARGGAQ
jgi:serine/threonine-protein kinase